jgi:hypothetical protein
MQDFRPDLLGKLLHGLAGAKYLLRHLPRLAVVLCFRSISRWLCGNVTVERLCWYNTQCLEKSYSG